MDQIQGFVNKYTALPEKHLGKMGGNIVRMKCFSSSLCGAVPSTFFLYIGRSYIKKDTVRRNVAIDKYSIRPTYVEAHSSRAASLEWEQRTYQLGFDSVTN